MIISSGKLKLYQSAEQMQGKNFRMKTMEALHAGSSTRPEQPHRHDYYTIVWAQAATGRHLIDFREYALSPDSIFFIGPGQVHQVVTTSTPRGLVINFTREFLDANHIGHDFIENLRVFRECDHNPPLFPAKESLQRLQQLASGMWQDYRQPRGLTEQALGAWLKLFLIECHSVCNLRQTAGQPGDSSEQLFRRFRKLVDINFYRWHKVFVYAEKLAVSPGHLNKVVKYYLGSSAKVSIQRRLLLEAKRMLMFSDLNTKETGYALGFEDPSNFSKFFRKQTGISAAAFRKRHRAAKKQAAPLVNN